MLRIDWRTRDTLYRKLQVRYEVLGLCFVQEAAKLHGGTARLENGPGSGARAVMQVPL